MVLDLHTLNLVNTVLSIIFAIVILMVRLGFKHQYRGTIDWVLAFVLNSFTQVIYILFDNIHFNNIMLLTGLILILSHLEFKRGWKKFFGIENSLRMDSALILSFVILFIFFNPSIEFWILLINFSSFLILLYTFGFIVNQSRLKHRYASPTIILFLFITLLFVLSAIIYLSSNYRTILDWNSRKPVLYSSSVTIVRDILMFFAVISAIIYKMRYDLEELVLEKEGLLDKMDSLSITDELTGLLNRRGFNRYLEWEVEKYKREGRGSTITLCDIDHFKVVNDTYGHDCGDKMIRHMASIFKKSLRSEDCVARWGGEEFIILQTNSTVEESITSLERIRAEICSSSITYKGEIVSATMSFGISKFDRDMDNYESIIKAADNNLYRAKESGRNKILYNKVI